MAYIEVLFFLLTSLNAAWHSLRLQVTCTLETISRKKIINQIYLNDHHPLKTLKYAYNKKH